VHENINEEAAGVLTQAQKIATELNEGAITTRHVMLAILGLDSPLVTRILQSAGLEKEKLHETLATQERQSLLAAGAVPTPTLRLRQAALSGITLAQSGISRSPRLDVPALVLGIIADSNCKAGNIVHLLNPNLSFDDVLAAAREVPRNA
jgi:ATP-dependent Clp protease ATP-binding subunit ClpA